jgi:anti-sigma28 factor (negative regulator of flagellin synthesis)
MNCNGIGSAKRVLTGKSIAAFKQGRTTRNSTSNSTWACAARAEESRESRRAGLLTMALSESDVRVEKVAALRVLIEAGTYKVAAEDVAASIIRSMLS